MRLKEGIKTNKNDYYLADAASFIIGKIFITGVIGALCNRIGFRGTNLSTIVSAIFYAIVLLRILGIIKKRFTKDMFFVIFFIPIMLCFTALFYPDNTSYLYKNLANLLFYCIPSYLIFRSIENLDEFIKRLNYDMYFIFSIGIIYFFGFSLRNNIRGTLQYDMPLSYSFVFPVLFFIYWGIKNKSILHFILAFSGIILILIQGSRGALLCVVVYFILYILRGNIRIFKKILYTFSITILTSIIYVNALQILQSLNRKLLNYGIHSRTIDYVINGTIMDSSGRDIIRTNAIYYIESNNIFGLGLYGDRVVLNTYPHDVFLEVLMQFGLIVGGVLILLFIILILKVLFTKKIDICWREFALVLLSFSLVYKCLSGSYLNDPDFWMMIGFLNKTVSTNKKTIT